MRFFFLLLLFCAGCARRHDCYRDDYQWEEIPSRPSYVCQEWMGPQSLYRAKVPEGWERAPPPPMEELVDTRTPLCRYCVRGGDEEVSIVVHNFPRESHTPSIPPFAQVSRWEKQIEGVESEVHPYVRGGFSGLLFVGEGRKEKVMAWSMQCGEEHNRQLCFPLCREERYLFPQICADYTIKAVGPTELMNTYQEEIIAFAESFELIHEIPHFS